MCLLPGDAGLSGGEIFTTWKGRKLSLKLVRKGVYRIKSKLGTPVGGPSVPVTMGMSTGFHGIATVSQKVARKLSLHLWEIPGSAKINGIVQNGTLRRARVRFGFEDTEYRLTAPVAVWER